MELTDPNRPFGLTINLLSIRGAQRRQTPRYQKNRFQVTGSRFEGLSS